MTLDFLIGGISGACIGAAIILFIWGFAGKANAQINAEINKADNQQVFEKVIPQWGYPDNKCTGYDEKGADK